MRVLSSQLVALSILGVVATVAACKTTSSNTSVKDAATARASVGLSLNDVSMLLPITDKSFVYGAVRANDKPAPQAKAPGAFALPTDDQVFLPDWALYALQNGKAMPANTPITAADLWSQTEPTATADFKSNTHAPLIAMALRIDPCANILLINGDDSKCQRQLRVLWRDTRVIPQWGDMVINGDTSVHTLYHLNDAEFTELVQTVAALKNAAGFDYSHEPLQIHPVMLKQGASGSYYQGMIGILHRFARASRIEGVAGMLAFKVSKTDDWRMSGFTVVNGTPVFASNPTITGGGHIQEFVMSSMGSITAGGGTSKDEAPTTTPNDAATTRLNYLAQINRINNPTKNDLTTVSCSGCHQSTFMEIDLNKQGSPVATDRYTNPNWNLSGMVEANATGLGRTTLQMFSYQASSNGDGKGAVIATRVITESAVVADYINAHYHAK